MVHPQRLDLSRIITSITKDSWSNIYAERRENYSVDTKASWRPRQSALVLPGKHFVVSKAWHKFLLTSVHIRMATSSTNARERYWM